MTTSAQVDYQRRIRRDTKVETYEHVLQLIDEIAAREKRDFSTLKASVRYWLGRARRGEV